MTQSKKTPKWWRSPVMRGCVGAFLVLTVGCTFNPSSVDVPPDPEVADAAPTPDATVVPLDAGQPEDAGRDDAGPTDAGPPPASAGLEARTALGFGRLTGAAMTELTVEIGPVVTSSSTGGLRGREGHRLQIGRTGASP